ncbi:MAG TPA: MBOAT family O-acyltransferase [Bryobacteraceae bacterium]|jgi:D-alanyl-lipoteichoic acid acyltransferase DltB (MBOAT superfamily)
MLFNSAPFFLFLLVTLILFYLSPRSWRRIILLVASYFFYGSWNWRFIPLLLSLTIIDYFCALWIVRAEAVKRKLAMTLSVAANLGFLGFFKYYNFLAGNVAMLAGQPEHAFFLKIVLPLGISFHTFQSISYVVDVYRGEQEPIHNFLNYAVFIAFFPQLVAGPIVRAREFFVDLFHWQPPTMDDIQRGVFLIFIGLAKKMALADQFAIVADSYFNNVHAIPGAMPAWSATVAFTLQIFFDFSGYTDIAIGTAKLFGFHFPLNFARPYLATSITDFWHRWHMSLSRWLRDYLYIPLGGNRHGELMTYRNLMLTMLLGGLWHGASWNFMIWGGYHGLLLSFERMRRGKIREVFVWQNPLRALLTFVLVCIGWVFFRARTFADSSYVLSQMFTNPHGSSLLLHRHYGMIVITLIIALFEERWQIIDQIIEGPRWVQATAFASIALAIELFGVIDQTIPFVYFQF